MKQVKFTKTAVGAAIAGVSLIAASSAFAAPTTKQMFSIADSWHNLGSGNIKGGTPNDAAGTANHSADTAEVCVFCHTPHGGDNTAAVPIWNRKLTDPTVYTRYSDLGTTTFDATEAPIGSVTIACLSCHDGTNAIDNVINAPGSGGYDPNGAQIGPNFTGSDQIGGKIDPSVVQMLGTDLSNDHPVSMQYAGGGISISAPAGPSNDPDFVAGSNPKPHPKNYTLNAVAAPANAQITTLWWIERGVGTEFSLSAGRDREDIILYTRIESGTGKPAIDGIEQPFVECGSCHDPHNIDNPTFLRVSNGVPTDSTSGFPNANGSPSGLCLSCHIK
jgi:cytochrome c556